MGLVARVVGGWLVVVKHRAAWNGWVGSLCACVCVCACVCFVPISARELDRDSERAAAEYGET